MSTQALNQAILEKYLVSLPKIDLRKVWIFGFIAIASLLLFYIFQISEITKDSSSVSHYEKQIVQLSLDNKNLEMSLSRANYLANLENILKELDYRNVGKIYYIRASDGRVAAKP